MKSILLPLVFVSAGRFVAGWGTVGHEIAATIAQMYLQPSTVDNLCALLPEYANCHLAPIAAWADKVRPIYRWSSTMHYVGDISDHPGDHCAFGETGWENPTYNVLDAIRNTTLWLQEGRHNPQEALKFLVHFIGDLHMPLHLTGRDRGGNEMKVRFDRRLTNLHSVWDTYLISKAIRTVPYNYTRPLPFPTVEKALRGTIYDAYIRQILWEGILAKWKDDLDEWLSCPQMTRVQTVFQQIVFALVGTRMTTDDSFICPFHWAKPIHKLNCELIWLPELDAITPRPTYVELDTPEYAGKIKQNMIIEKLLAMAGIRMAGTLNYLFGGENRVHVYL